MDNLQFVLCLQDLTKEEKTELMKKVLPTVKTEVNPTQDRPSITQTPSDESETIPTSDPEVSVYCQISQWESRGIRKVEKSSKVEKTSKIELYKNFEKVTKRDVRRDTLQNFNNVGCTKFCDLFCTRSNSLTFGTFYHFQYYTITVCNVPAN